MNNRGFISSSLLYGLLAVFLVVMLSIIALLGSKKLSMDKLKKNALEDINIDYKYPSNIVTWYDSFYLPFNNSNSEGTTYYWKDLTGNGYDGIISDKIKTSGRHLYFDRNSLGISVNKSHNYSFPDGFTISTCVRLTENVGKIFSVDDISVGVGKDKTDNKYGLKICKVGACQFVNVEGIDIVEDQKITIDFVSDINDGVKLFVNGKSVLNHKEISLSGKDMCIGDCQLSVNSSDDTADSNLVENTNSNIDTSSDDTGAFIGYIYNFIVYNKALGNDEHSSIHVENMKRFNSEE